MKTKPPASPTKDWCWSDRPCHCRATGHYPGAGRGCVLFPPSGLTTDDLLPAHDAAQRHHFGPRRQRVGRAGARHRPVLRPRLQYRQPDRRPGGCRRRHSRINIVTSGTSMVIEQIKAQLDRLVPVHRVADLTMDGPHVARELALVKVVGDRRAAGRGVAHRRYVPRPRGRHHAGEFRLRADRRSGQDGCVHRTDARPWSGGGVAHRGRRDRTRRALSKPPATYGTSPR